MDGRTRLVPAGAGREAGVRSVPSVAELRRRRAAAYDSWFDSPWGRYAFKVEARAVLGAIGDLHGQRLLDVGCGTGRFTTLLEAGGARVSGIDLDESLLALAAGRVRGQLLIADAHRLPFPDETFDVTFASTLLEFTVDPAQVISEMARVTVSGGRLVVGALNASSPWGIAHRHQFPHAPWAGAHFMDRRGLRQLGVRHGHASLRAVLFAPAAFPAVNSIGPLLELAGRVIPRWGAFQVLTVDLTSGARRSS